MCLFYVVHAWLCKNILLIFCARDGPVTLIFFTLGLLQQYDILDLMHAAEVTPTAATHTALLQALQRLETKKVCSVQRGKPHLEQLV
jgi:hypothetical protein